MDPAVLTRQLQGELARLVRGCAAGTFQSHGSTGVKSVTGVGFKPKLVEFSVTAQVGAIGTTTQIRWGTGHMTEAEQGAAFFAVDPNAPLVVAHDWNAGLCIYVSDRTGVTQYQAGFASMDQDGFSISVLAASTAYRVFWRAFA